MATAQISTVLTDAQGQPIATITDYGGDLVEGSTIISILTDAPNGLPTETITIQVPTGASVVLTKNNPADGKPTATVTLFPIIPNATPAKIVVPIETVYFLPILLTALLLLPMQVIDAEIKLFMPFRLLTRPDGSDLMILCTAALVSLSGETIGLKLRGTCKQHNLNTCFTTVAVFPEFARAAQGLLSALLVIILILAIMLNRWKTSVPAHPTSVAAVCALLQVPGTRGLVQGAQLRVTSLGGGAGRLDSNIAERYKEIRFRLGRAMGERAGGRRTTEYGLIGTREGDNGSPPVAARAGARTLMDGRPEKPEKMKLHVLVGERAEQGVYLFFLCGLLTLILYYELTIFEDPTATPFKWFMDSQTPGPRILFTAFGVLVSFIWDHLFLNFSKRATYCRMAQRNQPAALSILQTRPTNVFAGLWRAIRQRDSLTGSIALAGILSKFLPVFLSSTPFTAAQTWITHEICTWGAVAILIIMIVVLLSHTMLVKWPYMPAAAPDSLACCLYYVCDSAMLRDFEGLSML
ncbi:hypothetical protein QBC36DRAFT_315831 [Triangularia setosa]|uniref:Uncharacterized protein n=1 Tax=Triangularia setosa TaxID=2587417 RepID=A0AAN6VXU7_9PEZI|nr:hypothetical protein QBC36DRAFT_315831 [Podospora setosa]